MAKLQQESLVPLQITPIGLPRIPQTRVSEILKGKRRITADTVLRLSFYFGDSPKFWLGLQGDSDLEEELTNRQGALKNIRRFSVEAA